MSVIIKKLKLVTSKGNKMEFDNMPVSLVIDLLLSHLTDKEKLALIESVTKQLQD